MYSLVLTCLPKRKKKRKLNILAYVFPFGFHLIDIMNKMESETDKQTKKETETERDRQADRETIRQRVVELIS